MDEQIDELQLVIEVYDDRGNFEGEWAYEVSRESIEDWEEADQHSSQEGRTLVRYLLLSRLAEYSPITWQLLKNNVCVGEFVAAGVPSSIVKEIPRLNIVNIAVNRMYDCLSELVISEKIRIVH